MTNEEFLRTAGTEALVDFTVQTCSHCAFDGDDTCICDDTKECREGVRRWLQSERMD